MHVKMIVIHTYHCQNLIMTNCQCSLCLMAIIMAMGVYTNQTVRASGLVLIVHHSETFAVPELHGAGQSPLRLAAAKLLKTAGAEVAHWPATSRCLIGPTIADETSYFAILYPMLHPARLCCAMDFVICSIECVTFLSEPESVRSDLQEGKVYKI